MFNDKTSWSSGYGVSVKIWQPGFYFQHCKLRIPLCYRLLSNAVKCTSVARLTAHNHHARIYWPVSGKEPGRKNPVEASTSIPMFEQNYLS